MGFYDKSKEEREEITRNIEILVCNDYEKGSYEKIIKFSSVKDTYIRKIVYVTTGRLYKNNQDLRVKIINCLDQLFKSENVYIRQTVAYSLGEIGKFDAEKVFGLLEKALYDTHHSVRNAVVGALKQMGQKNPNPTFQFAKKFLHHEDPKVRRGIIHGVELRGRTHPEEVLPLLYEGQNDPDKKVREMVVHVIGQISYKRGCLEKVIGTIKDWENKDLVNKAIEEILEVHMRYEKFSAKTTAQAKEYIAGIIL